MIRSVLALRARAGMSQAVEEFYRDRGIIERAVSFPGCHGVALLRSVGEGPDTHVVIADWDDTAAYQRWVDDPWRAETSAALADLLDAGFAAGRMYEPVLCSEEPL
jgi:heme-degrading monooxygenase HmoA